MEQQWTIRPERLGDEEPIREVTERAFRGMRFSDGTEPEIPGRLREAGALAISLVAEQDGQIVGHVAFSPVVLAEQGTATAGVQPSPDLHLHPHPAPPTSPSGAGGGLSWYGLGPVSVTPELQRQGIGKAMIEEGLRRLKEIGAAGCVVLGDPNYYTRFGFRQGTSLSLPGFDPAHFMALTFRGDIPAADVSFHAAFL